MQPSSTARLAPLLLALVAGLLCFPPESDGRAMALFAVLASLLFVAVGRPGGEPLALTALTLSVVGISGSLALTPLAAVQPLALWILAAALFFVGSAARSGRLGAGLASGQRWSDLLGVIAAGLSLLALYQRFGGLAHLSRRLAADPSIPDREHLLERISDGRAFGTLATPAALGVLLAMALPGLALGVWTHEGRGRWVRAILCVLIAAGLAATASITAIAALAAVGGLMLIQRLGRQLLRPGRRRAATLLALALLAGVALSAVALRGAEIFDPDARGGPVRLRLANFRVAVTMIAADPLRGVGPGSFGEAYPAFRGPRDNQTRHVHNLPLELAAELGLPIGTAIATAVLWLGLIPALRAREAAVGPAAALATLTLHNLLDFTLFLPSLLWLGATLAGWLHASATEQPSTASKRLLLPAAAVVTTAAILLAFTGFSEEALRRSRADAAAADRESAERHAERAVALAPWNLDAAVALASTASAELTAAPALAERQAELMRHAERAVARAPRRASARAVRARARLLGGDAVGAWIDLRRACELHPVERSYREARDQLGARLGLPARGGP